MSPLLKATLLHFFIFLALISGFVLFIFVSSFFTTPHPDAYKDGVMSVVYVYGAFLVVYLPFKFIMVKTNFKLNTFAQKLNTWNDQSSVLDHIAIWFAMVTIINSIMMLTGIDAPKQGTFAYVHLLRRLLIVTLAVSLYMYKTIWTKIKSIKTEGLPLRRTLAEFLYATSKDAVDKPLTSSFKLMTVFTISWCLINIVFQPWMTPQGGAAFYMMLLIVYGAILIIILSVSFYIRKTSLKGK